MNKGWVKKTENMDNNMMLGKTKLRKRNKLLHDAEVSAISRRVRRGSAQTKAYSNIKCEFMNKLEF